MTDLFPSLLAPKDHDPDHLPDGLRLSTDCPVARIREFIDPSLRRPFPAGVGIRGHEISDRVGEWWLGPNAQAEVVIPWAHGNSHIDWVDPDIGDDGACLEIKSTTHGDHPTEDNFRQVQRMMWASEAADLDLPRAWYIVLVDVNYNKRGEFRVRLLDDRRDDINVEMKNTDDLLNVADTVDLDDIATFNDAGLQCRCGQCCNDATENPDLGPYLDTLYMLQEQDVTDEIKAVKAEIRDMLNPGDKHREPISVGGMRPAVGNVSLSKPREARKRTVKWAQALQAGAVDPELLVQLENAGYVTWSDATPRLTVSIKDEEPKAAMS